MKVYQATIVHVSLTFSMWGGTKRRAGVGNAKSKILNLIFEMVVLV